MDFTFFVSSFNISAPRGVDKRDNALSLQLVRPEHGGIDEYYFQNLDDGKYLVVDYEEEAIDHQWKTQRDHYLQTLYPQQTPPPDEPSLHFVCSPSEATLFRIKECGPLRNADLDLRIGSAVTFESGERTSYIKAKALVIDFRENGFGKEVKLKYSDFHCRWHDVFRIKGETGWITAESREIGDFNLYHPPCQWVKDRFYRKKWEMDKMEIREMNKIWGRNRLAEKRARVRAEKEGVIGEYGVDPKYEKRVKSRQKKQRKRMRANHRNWNGKCDDKRIERKTMKYGRIPKY